MLIEVIVSALLVAIIVVATFNGFDSASRLTVDQRRHAQAELLAAESNEKLRSDPATALDALETAPHHYSVTVGGNTYNITQEAKPLGPSGTTGCNVNEVGNEAGENIQITTSVTWATLEKAGRPAVKQASIITPPVGSALEVDVSNEGAPRTGVSGVRAIAKYTPSGSALVNTAEGTTDSNGCVVLTGLAATSATVEIGEKTNFVAMEGHLKVEPKEISIAPNITTHYLVGYDEGGRITAEYTYKGETSWEGQPVTGNTFVVSNESIPAGFPHFQTGSQAFKYQASGEEKYESVTTTYGTSATTATGAKYAKGDLFPFSSVWSAYAGDCPKNDTGPEATTSGSPVVSPGAATAVKVPLSRTSLTLNNGTYQTPGSVETTASEAVITNLQCEGYELPNNAFAASLVHPQTTNASGHLSDPFQPFGKAKLCVYDKAAKRTYTATYTDSTAEGTTLTAYFGQISKAEREAEEAPPREKLAKEEAEAKTAKEKREKEEKEAKTAKEKREKEEKEAKTAKEKREKEETEQVTAKATREAKEAAERKEWKEQEEGKKLPKISKAEREAKEKTQTKNRETAEKNEKTAREKREAEEAAAGPAKEKREAEEAAAGPAKEKREAEEAAAKVAKEKREAELAALNASRATREKEEKEAEEKTGFTVASGKSSC